MRNSPYGSVQAAVAAAYKAAGGLEKVGEALGLSVSSLSEANDPDKRPHGLGVNHLHVLGQIKPASAAAIANHFAALAGGVFQPVSAEGNACLFQLSADAPKELGEAGSAIVRAAQAASERQCEAEIREIDEAIEVLVRAKAEILGRGATPITRKSA